jgi:AbrB family looped-hinge helix DNA binding protein
MSQYEKRVTLGERGRLVLPAAVRRELHLKPGSQLLLSTDPDGSLRLRPYRVVAEQHRGMLRGLPGEPLVDDLLSVRRDEATREGG